MSVDFVNVYDMVGIELAFMIEVFLRELAFVKVVEESGVGHDMRGIEGAADALLGVLIHYFLYKSKFRLLWTLASWDKSYPPDRQGRGR